MISVKRMEALYGENLRQCARRNADDFFMANCDAKVVRLPSGRPVVNGFEISISHTGEFIAMMISDCGAPCGIDIEFLDRSVNKVAPRFASPAEIEICTPFIPKNPALLVWCAKEAVYKSLGREGVDFLHSMTIVSCAGSHLTALAYTKTIELEWRVGENNLLMVNTL